MLNCYSRADYVWLPFAVAGTGNELCSKAVTFALRAGYATAQERIAKGVDKISTLLKGVKDNTAAMAGNLKFGEVQ